MRDKLGLIYSVRYDKSGAKKVKVEKKDSPLFTPKEVPIDSFDEITQKHCRVVRSTLWLSERCKYDVDIYESKITPMLAVSFYFELPVCLAMLRDLMNQSREVCMYKEGIGSRVSLYLLYVPDTGDVEIARWR